MMLRWDGVGLRCTFHVLVWQRNDATGQMGGKNGANAADHANLLRAAANHTLSLLFLGCGADC